MFGHKRASNIQRLDGLRHGSVITPHLLYLLAERRYGDGADCRDGKNLKQSARNSLK